MRGPPTPGRSDARPRSRRAPQEERHATPPGCRSIPISLRDLRRSRGSRMRISRISRGGPIVAADCVVNRSRDARLIGACEVGAPTTGQRCHCGRHARCPALRWGTSPIGCEPHQAAWETVASRSPQQRAHGPGVIGGMSRRRPTTGVSVCSCGKSIKRARVEKSWTGKRP